MVVVITQNAGVVKFFCLFPISPVSFDIFDCFLNHFYILTIISLDTHQGQNYSNLMLLPL